MVKKQFVVIAYDISANKRRVKVAKILEKYGYRTNYSVFECLLGQSQLGIMKEELAQIIKPLKDIVLVYCLCKDCVDKRTQIRGRKEESSVVKVL